ncbi:MAG: hypothetical protein HUJ96_08040 [Marinilabiliaceae bacterium]|nr:hypothetical protein [Marinilabiliaceae bacterium]
MKFFFNPTCEIAIGQNNVNYQPPKLLKAFENDISPLIFYAYKHSCSVREVERYYSIHDYFAWGDSPTISHQREGLGKWTEERRLLHSRLTSVAIESYLTKMELPDWARPESIPVVASEYENKLSHRIVAKSLWSSSGRGVVIANADNSNLEKFVRAQLTSDGRIIIEPFMKRLVEMTFLFWIGGVDMILYLGINYFSSDKSGKFGYELIGINPMDEYEQYLPKNWEERSSKWLAEALQHEVADNGYIGFVGVDAMLHHSLFDDDKPHMRLCMEANLRLTMGNVNKGFAMQTNGKRGRWRIAGRKEYDSLEHYETEFVLAKGDSFVAFGDFF